MVKIFLRSFRSDPAFVFSFEPSLHLRLNQFVTLLKLTEPDENDS